MANAPSRAPLLGPAFIRLLAGLADVEAPRSPPVLSERLSQWFDWNRAITLSKALDDRLPAAAESAGFDDAQAVECARVRSTLVDAIVATVDPLPMQRSGSHAAADNAVEETSPQIEFAPFRKHCVDVQRAIQSGTGRLRGRLRDMLAQQSATKARLAEVDAVMELTLSPREQNLLGNVPNLLEKHFERLRDAAQLPEVDAPEITAVSPAATIAWLAVFQKDMQSALLAELDVRFHPIEGLLAALRTR